MHDGQAPLLERVSQAGAPVLSLVFVHTAVLHQSKKQYLGLVTPSGPKTALDGGNALAVL
jgi:hypothetical protein